MEALDTLFYRIANSSDSRETDLIQVSMQVNNSVKGSTIPRMLNSLDADVEIKPKPLLIIHWSNNGTD